MLFRMRRSLLLALVILSIGVQAGAQLPNLTYKYDPSYMTYPVTPTTVSPTPVPATVPATLPGNVQAIYWNTVGHNNGTAATPAGVGGIFNIDGKETYNFGSPGPFHPGAVMLAWDKGPFMVRGGRHTLEVNLDNQELILELDETDNVWAHQFVFTPYDLIDSLPVTRVTPPEVDGGFSSIIDGSPVSGNCDGFRFTSTGWWNVVTMYALGDVDDYDINLYSASTGSENGFIGSLVGSYAIAGLLDGVIVNRNLTGIQVYDAGVTNFSGSSNFVIEHVTSGIAGVGANMIVHFDENEYLKIWDTNFPDPGWFTVAVTDLQITGVGFQVALVDKATALAGLSTLPGKAFTDDDGEIRLHQLIGTGGYYGLVLFRDPTEGGMAMDLTVRIEPRAPDLMPGQVPLWHSPMVPTPVPMLGSLNPTLPDTLYGFTTETYLNYGLMNESTATSDAVNVAVYHDGDFNTFHGFTTSGFGAGEVRGDIFSSPFMYPGGRHTLTVEADYTNSIHETYESNNSYAEQYCWSPLELSPGQQYSHDHPGERGGGFEYVAPGDVFYSNCDGYRLMTGNSHWDGMVLTQGPGSDYDLTVHNKLEGVKNGFDHVLAYSEYLNGQTDYVLFNNSMVPPGAHDVGVRNFSGTEPYTIEAVESTTPPMPIGGHYGPYTMPISNMLHLHNVYLEQDLYAFRLDNLAGGADWSIALHPFDMPRGGRSQVVTDGSSNQGGSGEAEWFTVYIGTPGWYCLAVCKATPFDFDLEGVYELTILRGVSDVADEAELPTATALSGVHPNPFNPQTTISFDLAVAADVALDLYDLKGARVRRLINAAMPVGRHAAVWNGEDDSGHRVASGVYLVRFCSGKHSEVGKLVMLK